MDRSLYIAMSGAKQTLLAQTTNSNNLANTQTIGFKSDLEQFRSMPVFGAGYPTRVYAMTENPGTNLTHGIIKTTGRDQDVAINGEGFLAVQGPDGKEAYTRAGDLQLTPQGALQTGAGFPVIGQNGPIIIPPTEKLTIGSDGTITSIPLGSGNASSVAIVDRIKLVNPPLTNLVKLNDGLLHTKDGQPVPADVNVKLESGALEGSNVNPLNAMVDMIELARNYELQTKVMKTANDNSAVSAKIMQMA